jgi:hypothetical protein
MVVLGLLAAVGTAPGLVEQQALSLLSRKASTVLSNVPGPREPRYLCGRRIRQQLFWVPQSGSIGIGISILTYDGSAQLGLIADRNLIPEPKDVAHRFTREFDRLVMALMMDGPVRKSGEGDSAGRSG